MRLDIRAEPVECLAVCKRPCTVAFAGESKWTYVIGDLDKACERLDEIIASAQAFRRDEEWHRPWKERPACFKKGVVSRTPPLGFARALIEPLQALFRLGALNRVGDEAARLLGVAPARDLRPFAGLEILVMGEEMFDLP